ncbi:uncharacterized protein LOC144132991 [Amblyomma americanum]
MTLATRVSTSQREWRGAPFPVEGDESEEGIESTMTPLDEEHRPVEECQVSKGAMRGIQNTDPLWFGELTLDPQSVKQPRSPQEVGGLTGQRKAARVEPDREEWRIRVPEPDGALVVQLWRHTLLRATVLRPRRLPTPFRPSRP